MQLPAAASVAVHPSLDGVLHTQKLSEGSNCWYRQSQRFAGRCLQPRRRWQVEFTHDKRAVKVTTKDTAPGGRRTEKVGLPYDPDLFDHMVSHGVVVEVTSWGPLREPKILSHSLQLSRLELVVPN